MLSNKFPNQVFVIGGGHSIKEGFSYGLPEILKNKFTIGLNWSFHHFPDCTFYSYVDKGSFFEKAGKDTLEKLPLIVCKDWGINHLPNTIPLCASSMYHRELYPPKPYPQNKGVYSAKLVGLFALTLAIYLIQEGTIYLLGYDGGSVLNEQKDQKNRILTHYYQEEGNIKHNGIGRVNWYKQKDRLTREFAPYQNEERVKIYNVSPNSNIDTFEKIGYEEFIKRVKPISESNQEMLREEIKEKLLK